MATQERLGTMVHLGRRLGWVEVVLDFRYFNYGLHGVWNSSGRMKWHLRVSELSGEYRLVTYTPSYCYFV